MPRIAILATDGFEQSELMKPRDFLRDAGAQVDIVSLAGKSEIKGWDQDDWGQSVSVDRTLDDAQPGEYDALVLPGGQINPDKLRVESAALGFIRGFAEADKPVAAICHAPWLLVEAGLAEGRELTSFESIRTDLANAGAQVRDASVVRDGNLITSRNPDDLDDFNAAIAQAVGLEAGQPA